MGILKAANFKIKTNWCYWGCKLWITMSILSGNASAQTSSDAITNNVSQCGLSITGGYVQKNNQDSLNNSDNGGWRVMTTLNTNPCANQRDLERIRQENETKRELIRQESENNREFMRTCINARVQATQRDINPDVICKLPDLQNNFSNVLPTQKLGK
ncbi:hypothetical protein NIES4074_60070 (plasmid) [Cylindrospermum sp. NIES-4074]|nr:hypothetical protein NIES4074_60070 [Cylindrospermum sp. NIES-4074]